MDSSLREMINYFERLFKVEDDGQDLLWMKVDLKDRLAQRIEDEEQRSFVESLCLRDYEDMNNAVINFIRKHLQESAELKIKDKSLGQVLYACSQMENESADNIEFVNCILLLYSIAFAQMKGNRNFVNKMVGNSLFGAWEYNTLPTESQNMELLTGFDSRSKLELVMEKDSAEKIKNGKWNDGLEEFVESQKEKIMGWLYALIFVNTSFSTSENYAFDINVKVVKSEGVSETVEPVKYHFSVNMRGMARKSCFGFLHCNQSEEINRIKNILWQSMRELTRKVPKFVEANDAEKENTTEQAKDTEAIAEELAKLVWDAMGIEAPDVEPFPVQNVEILYGIGRALEDVVSVDDGKTSERLFEKMVYEYRIISEKLEACDRRYNKLGISTGFADNFKKRVRAKIFLEPGYLEKKGDPKAETSVRSAFIKQLGSLYYTTNIRLQDPT